MRAQVMEMRDRVAVVEEQFGRLDPKVDRILAQIEQQWQPSSLGNQPPADQHLTSPFPAAGHLPGRLPLEASLDFTITREVTTPAGEIPPPPPAPVKSLKPTAPGRGAEPDCLLQTLKGKPC
jgi:hypothetical protein